MARPPRIEFPGAFYHVIVRGNRKQDIFSADQDRVEYLERVRHYKEKCGFVLYAYVLMTNHVHLLIETPKTPLSKIMQLLNFTYTQYFNRKYGKTGHLFQGRYKAFLCDRDEYLLALVRYIHLNPIRAMLTEKPHEYRWSSHSDYLRGNTGIVDTDRVLRLFSENVYQARRLYGNFVKEALWAGRDETFYKPIGQQILGDEKFMEKVERVIDSPDMPIRKPSLDAIFKAVKEQTTINRDEIISRSRRQDVVFARGLLVAIWREIGYKMTRLQPVLRRDLSMLSKLSKVAESAQGQRSMKKLLEILNARIQA